ncbi:hypothetical protein D3C79_707920 [compost metagenome]
MRLIHKHRHPPLVDLGKTIEQSTLVEIVVVVGHQHIDPTRHLLPQVIRADLMSQGNLAQCGLVEDGQRLGRLASSGQTVVEAFGQGAGLAMARRAGVLAGFVAGHQFQAAQGKLGSAVVDLMQGFQGQGTAGCLGGEKEDLVQLLRDHGLEQREQGTKGLADTGGGLGHQAAPGTYRLVHSLGKIALAAAHLPVRKAQRLQPGVAQGYSLQLLFGPVQEDRALAVEVLLKLQRTAALFDQGLAVAVDIQVHQGQVDFAELTLLAEQPAIDSGLGPVQLPMIIRLARQVAAVGLDFLQAIELRVIAVGPAAHLQGAKLPFKADLSLESRPTPGHHPLMAADALLGRGRRSEAQVQIAHLGAELAQCSHCHAITHGVGVIQRTWHTATGRPCSLQKSIQRSWLSCRRSPGPLTSIIR